MPPLSSPSQPPSKEPPDKPNIQLSLSVGGPAIDTSKAMLPSQTQPPASPTLRPPFSPFFTLIHDTATATTHHPRNVHYIFSDDDPSLLTTACLSALSSQQPSPSNPATHPRPQNVSPSSSGSAASKSSSASTAAITASKPKREDLENRVLLLDLDDSGTTVSKAHSLSSSWQILSTSLTPAPTWEESSPSAAEAPVESGSSAGFMLKISGTDARQVRSISGVGTGLGLGGGGGITGREEGKNIPAAGLSEAEFQALMLEFDSRMKILRTVVDTGVEIGLKQEAGGLAELEDSGERGGETTKEEK